MGASNAHGIAVTLAMSLFLPTCTAGTDLGRASSGVADGLAWTRLGSGPAMIVVHGGPGLEHRYLRAGLDGLAESVELVYYDQRGVGGSVGPGGGVDTLRTTWTGYLNDLDTLVTRFSEEGGAVLLAHSWGALLALAYASAHPVKVRGLILVAPVDPGERYAAETSARARSLVRDSVARFVMDSIARTHPEKLSDPVVRSRLLRLGFRTHAPNPSAIDALDLRLTAATARNADAVARAVMGSRPSDDGWATLPDVSMPVLLVQGTQDLPPPGMVVEMAARMPNARITIIPGAGHFPFADDPARFRSVVGEFLADIAPPAG